MIAWGQCAYDPGNPAFSYFGLGEAAAALAFTLAVPQFIKPIYRMRLAARRIRTLHIFSLAFCGAAFSLIGGLLPHIPIQRDFPLAYPAIWEMAGGVLFAVAFGLLAFGSIVPLTARAGRVRSFAQAVAHFLTIAQPADHVEFAEQELASNFERLTRFANIVDWFQEPSAFFLFTHRRAIEDGQFAGSLLRIASDPRLCRTIVDRTPWLAADLVRMIDEKRIRCRAAERLIQEIALQAIVSNESMLDREAGYGGFSNAPVLADSLFGSSFIAQTYRPMHWLSIGFSEPITRPLVRRFNMAAKQLLATSLKDGEFWQASAHYDVSEIYKRMVQDLRLASPEAINIDTLVSVTSGVKDRMRAVRTALASLPVAERQLLYKIDDRQQWGENLVEVYAELANELLETISNDFSGLDDRFWSFAIDLWHSVFPFHENEIAGFDPFQQRLALHIRAKVTENMEGWYPALTRLILAVQGPHGPPPRIQRRSAYVIFGDLFYTQLRTGLPRLAAGNPEKLNDFLPPSVAYDTVTNTLTRTFTGGTQRQTALAALELEPVDLYDRAIWLDADRAP
ncbi:MAG: hypothetical protein DCF29_26460 [Alphaproteobacteria bacterium]|jgi:hypothetical protein|nr:MAG: hypothetical protein DCF29_26460 [Alphaproteobacteria bacterium]